jgi:outer membrane lipoprotein-sorting protein
MARIRYQAEMFGNHLVGKGSYLQQGQGLERKMRLELETPIGDQNLVLEQICDGQFLWQYQPPIARNKQAAPERPTVTRIDIRRVLAAIEQDKHATGPNVASQLALGGLPKLMEGVRQSFRFNRAEAGKLGELPVWIATGSWRPEALAVFAKDLADQAANGRPLNLKRLPQQLPEEISVYFGQDDLFPYRIEYRRRTAQQGRGGESDGEMLPIVIVEFCDVRLNVPIDPLQFEYRPGNEVDVVDATQNFMKTLGLKQ